MASEQEQQLLNQAQLYQQQMQTIMMQKENISIQLLEIKKALDETEKVEAKREIYKVSGPILIKSTKAEVLKDLKEKQETLNVRMKTLESGEKKAKAKISELREKLTGK
jgi:prefoldin beta subunit